MKLYLCSMVELCTRFGSSDMPPLEPGEKCPHKQMHQKTHGCTMNGGCSWSDMKVDTEFMHMNNECLVHKEEQ